MSENEPTFYCDRHDNIEREEIKKYQWSTKQKKEREFINNNSKLATSIL